MTEEHIDVRKPLTHDIAITLPAVIIPEKSADGYKDDNVSVDDHSQTEEHSVISRILNGGFHLRRLIPIRKLLVPSGPGTGIAGTAFNTVKATVGAGILSLPLAVHYTGLGVGMFLILLMAILTVVTINMMLEAADKCSASTYEVLAFKSFGMLGAKTVDILTIVSGFGSLIAYHVLAVEFIQPVIIALAGNPTTLLGNKLLILGILDAALIIPLSLKKKLNSLRFAVYISIALVIVLVVVVVYFSVEMMQVVGPPNPIEWAPSSIRFFDAAVLIAFSYQSHTNTFPIYAEMNEPTTPRMRQATSVAVSFTGILYMLVGVFGYLAFGATITGNIIANFPLGSAIVLVLRFAYCMVIVFTFPYSMFTIRLSIEHYYHGMDGELHKVLHYVLTIGIGLASAAIAAFVSDVSIVFSFAGSLGGAMLMFIMPAGAYIKQMGWSNMTIRMRVLAVVIISLGIAMGVLGIISSALTVAGVTL